MDRARIHCDENITAYLRSLGLIVIFGFCKKHMKKTYQEGNDLPLTVASTMIKFTNYDSTALFLKCGYNYDGTFDPMKNI